MDKYVRAFGPDDLEVICNLLHISQRYQSYCKIKFSLKLLFLFLTLNSELLGSKVKQDYLTFRWEVLSFLIS